MYKRIVKAIRARREAKNQRRGGVTAPAPVARVSKAYTEKDWVPYYYPVIVDSGSSSGSDGGSSGGSCDSGSSDGGCD